MQERMKSHQLDRAQIEALLDRAEVGHLATVGPDGFPYVVPIHYARIGGRLYVHGLGQGQKLDNIARDPKVGLEVSFLDGFTRGDGPCDTNTVYRSVIVRGLAKVVEDEDLVRRALSAVVAKYAPDLGGAPFSDAFLAITSVIEIEPEEITGKYWS